ncbi:MAG: hypothetical protein KF889_28255 [Alphaproteobacteria bacterium]|nr:hypothetical protein [Alphaproteobacteria bacterium]MCW5743849.1 hypothetical protein [Alphaproteobacteria bacterium]
MRVLKDRLTDPAQIPIRDWVALDADHRQAIETRLDHNARGTEPAPNPALVDELATEKTEAPHAFVRRDLVPAVAQLPLQSGSLVLSRTRTLPWDKARKS